MVLYDYYFGGSLGKIVSSINDRQDKIVAVTLQNGIYTVIVEMHGNKKDGDTNG